MSLSTTKRMDIWDVHDLFFFGDIDAPWTLFYEPDIDSYTSLACLLDLEQAKRLSPLPLLLGEEVNR